MEGVTEFESDSDDLEEEQVDGGLREDLEAALSADFIFAGKYAHRSRQWSGYGWAAAKLERSSEPARARNAGSIPAVDVRQGGKRSWNRSEFSMETFYDGDTAIKRTVTLDGNPVDARNFKVEEEDFMPKMVFEKMDPDYTEYAGYMGNCAAYVIRQSVLDRAVNPVYSFRIPLLHDRALFYLPNGNSQPNMLTPPDGPNGIILARFLHVIVDPCEELTVFNPHAVALYDIEKHIGILMPPIGGPTRNQTTTKMFLSARTGIMTVLGGIVEVDDSGDAEYSRIINMECGGCGPERKLASRSESDDRDLFDTNNLSYVQFLINLLPSQRI
ncbi:hypothetical protein B0H17DRAFT_1149474 [Mycena rosella]|uniref:Uncharacterized protein n=1 Tax=Mycena rosella TaxID=1033263 RepID=A0AAD7FQQ0_MYCRO|nr:hypothetical protein B0H17DRAFT_1149474 [Mycena rosella]